jgi:hypothetical protein
MRDALQGPAVIHSEDVYERCPVIKGDDSRIVAATPLSLHRFHGKGAARVSGSGTCTPHGLPAVMPGGHFWSGACFRQATSVHRQFFFKKASSCARLSPVEDVHLRMIRIEVQLICRHPNRAMIRWG